MRFTLTILQIQQGAAVFPALGTFDFAAEIVGEPMHAVANAEDGQTQGEHAGIALGSIGIINGAGAAGKNQASGLELADLFDGGGTRKDGGKDLLFTNAASDELSVLAAEV